MVILSHHSNKVGAFKPIKIANTKQASVTNRAPYGRPYRITPLSVLINDIQINTGVRASLGFGLLLKSDLFDKL